MHLMTFLQLKKPSLLFRAAVLAAQGVFYNAFFLAYLIHPKAAHRCKLFFSSFSPTRFSLFRIPRSDQELSSRYLISSRGSARVRSRHHLHTMPTRTRIRSITRMESSGSPSNQQRLLAVTGRCSSHRCHSSRTS